MKKSILLFNSTAECEGGTFVKDHSSRGRRGVRGSEPQGRRGVRGSEPQDCHQLSSPTSCTC